MEKTVVFVCHGQAVGGELTEIGHAQAEGLGLRLIGLGIELVATSSAQPCVETAMVAFDHAVPIAVFDSLRDRGVSGGSDDVVTALGGRETIDMTRAPEFSSFLWTSDLDESEANIAARFQQTLDWLLLRPESKIAVISHSRVLGCGCVAAVNRRFVVEGALDNPVRAWDWCELRAFTIKSAVIARPVVLGNSQSVSELRRDLGAAGGLKNLESYMSTDPKVASRIFSDCGFVVVPGALTAEQVARLSLGCRREAAAILERDRAQKGNRHQSDRLRLPGRGRYSFGVASKTKHLMHCEEWASLVDVKAVIDVLDLTLQDYRCTGSGGDFVVPGTNEYQELHSDLGKVQRQYLEREAPVVCVNFTVSELTWENGPTRIIPRKQYPPAEFLAAADKNCWWWPPSLDNEPEDWKLSTLCPVPAGSAIIRDIRCWHGGTPNLSKETRYLPSCSFTSSWWLKSEPSNSRGCMPASIFNRLSARGRALCADIVADDRTHFGVREDCGSIHNSPDTNQKQRSAKGQWLHLATDFESGGRFLIRTVAKTHLLRLVTLQSLHSKMWLNLCAGRGGEGVNVQMWDNPHSPHSQWFLEFLPSDKGHCTIRSSSSKMYLRVTGTGTRSFVQTTANPTCPESHWMLESDARLDLELCTCRLMSVAAQMYLVLVP